MSGTARKALPQIPVRHHSSSAGRQTLEWEALPLVERTVRRARHRGYALCMLAGIILGLVF